MLLILFFVFTLGYNRLNQEFGKNDQTQFYLPVSKYVTSGTAPIDTVNSGPRRMQQVLARVESWTDEATKEKPKARKYKNYLKGVVITVIATAITVMLLAIFSILFLGIKKIAAFPPSWQHSIVKDQVEWIQLPAQMESEAVKKVSLRIIIPMLFSIGTVLNVFALLAAIDVVWFALADHTLLFPQIQNLMTWTFVPFLVMGMLTGTESAWIWGGLARSVMVILASPSLLIMGRRIIKVCSDFASRSISSVLNLFLFRQVPEKLTIHINKLCQLYNIECPKVIRIRSKAVHLAVLPSLVGNRSMLLLSGGAISQLTETELIAAVAHELAHIKQGMGNIRLLRILSILGGYPPWFLLLLVDFRKLEEDADRFALSAGAEPQALARAIIKTSSSGGQSSWLRASIMMWLRKHLPNQVLASFVQPLKLILVTDRFLTSDDLVGYSHPLPRDRIATILSDEKMDYGNSI